MEVIAVRGVVVRAEHRAEALAGAGVDNAQEFALRGVPPDQLLSTLTRRPSASRKAAMSIALAVAWPERRAVPATVRQE
jgi:hypothetical protein